MGHLKRNGEYDKMDLFQVNVPYCDVLKMSNNTKRLQSQRHSQFFSMHLLK